ncbi:TPM domain-containing protein [Vagococcus carniphilus]|uniref:TPM domain-containing protein n=1 Tax=Vagococcus carniphilus TaxID=218144 RepID=UPI002891EBA6|nr:TPM domain-containing protein [Vagococcus carniphilus]MDT2866063.1 TPM domain-containing protein [Vagococcus carniphilus]
MKKVIQKGNLKIDDSIFEKVWHFGRRRYVYSYFFICLSLGLILLSFFISFFGLVDMKNDIWLRSLNTQKINELKKEKESIEESFEKNKTKNPEGTFDNAKKDLLNEWDITENNQTVSVSGTELAINQNNVFVSDNAKVLTDTTRRKIYDFNKQMAETQDEEQLVVVTVQELPSGETVETFSQAVFETLGIGQKSKNNGVLYLMAINNRATRIHVGYGLEEKLTDSESFGILHDEKVRKAFQEESYSKGVSRIVDLISEEVLSNTPEIDSEIREYEYYLKNTRTDFWLGIVLTIAFLIGIIVGSFCCLISTYKLNRKLKELIRKDNFLEEKEFCIAKISKEQYDIDLFYLYKGCPLILFFYFQLVRAIKAGHVLILAPKGAKTRRMGKQILINETLYDIDGRILTTRYSSSSYRSGGGGGSSSGGGFGGGSFGGGSSGGGGASGGW